MEIIAETEKLEEPKEPVAHPESEAVAERKEKIVKFVKKSNWLVYAILAVILWLNIHIRSLPIPRLRDVTTGGYILGPDLDPYLFLRYAKNIVENGSLMVHDMMRYVPLGYETIRETRLLPYMIAYLHKFISLFSEVSVEYSAVIFPVVFSVITTVFFFLLVRKIFEEKKETSNIIALIATLFLVLLPSLLPRTIAGIPEKESAGFGLMFAAIYFFLYAWKSKNLKASVIMSALAGVFTALMGLIWGGWIFVFVAISVSVLLSFVFEKVKSREVLVYVIWIALSFIIPLLFSQRYNLKGMLLSTTTGLSFGVFILLVVDFVIFRTKLKEIGLIRRLRKKISDRGVSILIAIILIVVGSSLVLGISFLPGFFSKIVTSLTSPYADRLAFTVAENRQPYFNEWKGSFGPIVGNQPLFFWLFFIGSIYLFYEMIKGIKKKDRWTLTVLYTISLFFIIFSRHSAGSVFNGVNTLSKLIYFSGFAIIILAFAYIYRKYHKARAVHLLTKINFAHLFLFILFFLSLIAARSAVRLIMTLAPVGAIIISYFVVGLVVQAKETKDKEELTKILIWAVAVVVIIATLFTLYSYYGVSRGTAKSYVPSAYNIQWQKAMAWVRNNTSEDAVFGHWWDYGYWIQTIGQRATMLDGGNSVSYWNYLMGRYVLTSPNQSSALELLYSHNVTHYLIDSTEIGKYSAYSNIGSDENYDRYSWIGTFLLNEQATHETSNTTVYVYQGGISLDEDYLYPDETTGQQILLPGQRAGVGAMVLTESKRNTFEQPEAIFVYQGRQFKIPLRYLFYKDKLYDFKTGYEGCLFVFPAAVPQGSGVGINDRGAALFLSERNMRALWVRLFLLGEEDRFKLVHTESNFVIEDLRSQGMEIGEFIYYQGIQGPIKIWEIQYTGNEKVNPEFIQRDYPERIMERRYAN